MEGQSETRIGTPETGRLLFRMLVLATTPAVKKPQAVSSQLFLYYLSRLYKGTPSQVIELHHLYHGPPLPSQHTPCPHGTHGKLYASFPNSLVPVIALGGYATRLV